MPRLPRLFTRVDDYPTALVQVASSETHDGPGVIRRANPYISVWCSSSMEQKQRLFHGRGMRAVQCLAFSPNGNSLVSICTDNSHTMFVWKWKTAQCMLQCKTRAGAPPSVYGVVWSPFETERLVTFGHNHVMFWRLHRDISSGGKQVPFLPDGMLLENACVLALPTPAQDFSSQQRHR
jgi:WD40 repeat protein